MTDNARQERLLYRILSRVACVVLGHGYVLEEIDTERRVSISKCVHCGDIHEEEYSIIAEEYYAE